MIEPFRLVWTLEAKEGLSDILEYLDRSFSQKVKADFINDFERQLAQISQNPFQFI